MPSILLFGATGLMGSHLVGALKKTHPTYPLTVYIRSTTPSLHSYLRNTIGVDEIITGDFSETDKISKLASEYDVVINCGSSWDVGLTQAIIEGLVRRFEEGKGKGRYFFARKTGFDAWEGEQDASGRGGNGAC